MDVDEGKEAEAVRTEVSRRLLEADRRATAEAVSAGQAWPVVAMVAGVLIVGGAFLYRGMGAPGYPDLPMAERLAEIEAAAAARMGQAEAEELAGTNLPNVPEADPNFLKLMEELRSVLQERPDDLR